MIGDSMGIFASFKPVGINMRFEVMDGVERLVMQNSKGASGKGADQERAKQTWGVSDSNGVNFGPIVDLLLVLRIFCNETSLFESLMDNWQDGF